MINPEIRETLSHTAPDAVILDNPSFDNSIIGIATCGAIVYSLDKMIEELAGEDNISSEEALDFIEYNTLRALGYMSHEGLAPIVVDESLFR
jgi:hypothetical protein